MIAPSSPLRHLFQQRRELGPLQLLYVYVNFVPRPRLARLTLQLQIPLACGYNTPTLVQRKTQENCSWVFREKEGGY